MKGFSMGYITEAVVFLWEEWVTADLRETPNAVP
jgi:hypothetical protein